MQPLKVSFADLPPGAEPGFVRGGGETVWGFGAAPMGEKNSDRATKPGVAISRKRLFLSKETKKSQKGFIQLQKCFHNTSQQRKFNEIKSTKIINRQIS